MHNRFMLSAIYIFTFSFLAGNLSLHALAELPSLHWSIGVVCGVLLLFSKLKWRLLGGFCLGLFWTAYSIPLHSGDQWVSTWEGEVVSVVGQIVTIPVQRMGRTQFILDIVEAPDSEYFPKRVRISIYRHKDSLRIGDLLRAQIKMKAPYGLLNPDTFDYERWLMMRGIEATAYVVSYQRLDSAAAAEHRGRWRQELFDKLQSHRTLWPQVDSIAAITLGLSSLLSYQQRDILSATGTHHLFAVSGLHIGLVFGLFFVLIGRLWTKFFLNRYLYPSRDIALLGALPAAVFYAALAGFSVPTQRALIMLVCVVCANFFRYRISLPQSLCVALLLILIYDPLATLSISFCLSFAAVAMIALFLLIAPQLRGWRLWFGMQAYIATAMIIPSLLFFDQGALISPLANMLIVPLTAFLVLPCSLLAVAAFLVNDALALWLLPIAAELFEMLWQINAWLANRALRWFHSLNTVTAFFAMIGIVLCIAIKRRSVRWLAVLLFCPLLPLFNTPSTVPAGAFKAVFFDVGQGLSVLLRTQNHTLIYDTGAHYPSGFNMVDSVIMPYLRAQRITAIDALVVSHADNDHAGGVKVLLRHSTPRRLLSGEEMTGFNTSFERCQSGQSWVWDDVHFEILYPQSTTVKGNNASCVLRISNRKHSLLLTADIEKQAERVVAKHPSLSSDVMLIPHHGSRTSSTPELIAAVAPTIAVVTSGYRNRFGLPKADVVSRYYERGIQVLDTAKTGALIFDFPPDRNFDIQAYRARERRYWRTSVRSLWPATVLHARSLQ